MKNLKVKESIQLFFVSNQLFKPDKCLIKFWYVIWIDFKYKLKFKLNE